MKGSYILVVYISKNTYIEIGALGNILFREGYYLYIGSAMGNSGSSTLNNRIMRHLSFLNKKLHWHIDYLLNNPFSIFYRLYLIPTNQNYECTIAKEILKISEGFIQDFGSSDCKCKSHLFYFKDFKGLDKLPLKIE
ncbi:MAG: DUF123 domain-containing protein [Promethearchaeota archaeon]